MNYFWICVCAIFCFQLQLTTTTASEDIPLSSPSGVRTFRTRDRGHGNHRSRLRHFQPKQEDPAMQNDRVIIAPQASSKESSVIELNTPFIGSNAPSIEPNTPGVQLHSGGPKTPLIKPSESTEGQENPSVDFGTRNENRPKFRQRHQQFKLAEHPIVVPETRKAFPSGGLFTFDHINENLVPRNQPEVQEDAFPVLTRVEANVPNVVSYVQPLVEITDNALPPQNSIISTEASVFRRRPAAKHRPDVLKQREEDAALLLDVIKKDSIESVTDGHKSDPEPGPIIQTHRPRPAQSVLSQDQEASPVLSKPLHISGIFPAVNVESTSPFQPKDTNSRPSSRSNAYKNNLFTSNSETTSPSKPFQVAGRSPSQSLRYRTTFSQSILQGQGGRSTPVRKPQGRLQTSDQDSNIGLEETSRRPHIQSTGRRLNRLRQKAESNILNHESANQVVPQKIVKSGDFQEATIQSQPLHILNDVTHDRVEQKFSKEEQPTHPQAAEPIIRSSFQPHLSQFAQVNPSQNLPQTSVEDALFIVKAENPSNQLHIVTNNNADLFTSIPSVVTPKTDSLSSRAEVNPSTILYVASATPFPKVSWNENLATEIPVCRPQSAFKASHFPSFYSNSVFGSKEVSTVAPARNDFSQNTVSSSQNRFSQSSRGEVNTAIPSSEHAFSHGFDRSKFDNFPGSLNAASKIGGNSLSNPRSTEPRIAPPVVTGPAASVDNSFFSIENTLRNNPRISSTGFSSQKQPDFSNSQLRSQSANYFSQVGQSVPTSSPASQPLVSQPSQSFSSVNFQTSFPVQTSHVNTQFQPISTFNVPLNTIQRPNVDHISSQSNPVSISFPPRQPAHLSPQYDRISFPLAPSQSLPFPSRLPNGRSDVTALDVYYPVYGTLYMTDKNMPNVTSRIDFIQTVPSGSYSKFNL